MTEPRSDLDELLTEQIGFLITSSKLYDDGNEAEAKRLATVIRTLLHQTKSSTALLAQVGLFNPHAKGGLYFLDTSPPAKAPWAPTAVGGEARLCFMKVEAGDTPTEAAWVPKLDGGPGGKRGYVAFTSWWDRSPVVISQSNEKFTRKELVLVLANKEGGAHVDPKGTPVSYENLKTGGAMGVRRTEGGIEFSIGEAGAEGLAAGDTDLNPGPASVRQISHEILRTLAAPRAELVADYPDAFSGPFAAPGSEPLDS